MIRLAIASLAVMIAAASFIPVVQKCVMKSATLFQWLVIAVTMSLGGATIAFAKFSDNSESIRTMP